LSVLPFLAHASSSPLQFFPLVLAFSWIRSQRSSSLQSPGISRFQRPWCISRCTYTVFQQLDFFSPRFAVTGRTLGRPETGVSKVGKYPLKISGGAKAFTSWYWRRRLQRGQQMRCQMLPLKSVVIEVERQGRPRICVSDVLFKSGLRSLRYPGLREGAYIFQDDECSVS
jgi:hypothetical protein